MHCLGRRPWHCPVYMLDSLLSLVRHPTGDAGVDTRRFQTAMSVVAGRLHVDTWSGVK